MARIGTAEVASRYDGVAVGPRLAYLFETQEGLPVDGTNELLRNLSPFTLRLLPPDALLQAADTAATSGDSGDTTSAVSLLTTAALGADTSAAANAVFDALAGVSAIGNASATLQTTANLESFVATGQFFTGQQQSAFISTLADAFTAADISLQLLKILTVPPLTLLVNPSEMSISYTKIQSYQSRTRFGYVFEAWGQEQPTISFSGSTAGFAAGAVDTSNPYGGQITGNTASVSGYQPAARLDSAAWQNFVSLYHFYRSNGYIYDTINGSEAHQFIGAIAIDYDQWTYVGNIDSFSFSFEEDAPFKVTWEMEFHVSKMFDRALSQAYVMPQNPPTSTPTSVTKGSQAAVGIAAGLTNALGDLAQGQVGAAGADIAETPLDLLGPGTVGG